MKPIRTLFAAATSLLWLTASAFALAPESSFPIPPGGQLGTEQEVTLPGQRLDDAQEILFYGAGIQATKIVEAKTNSLKVVFKIAPDCSLGEHVFRIRTASGITEARSFYVGTLPNVLEKEPNTERSQAQKIPLNVTVNGSIEREDVDYYSVDCKKGQRLSLEVEGIRLGHTMFDPYVAVQKPDGTILAQNDDNALFVQDPALSMIVPEDGQYLVQVRDTSYGGNDRCQYRLHVGDFPRPLAVYPPGGKAGDTLKVTFIGDAGGNFTQDIKLPAEPSDRFPALAVRDGHSAPSPNWLRVSSFPNVLEVEPNDDQAHATPTDLNAPVALNGIIDKKGDADWFRFKAKKDQVFDVNVFARQLRSPLDSVLNIYDEKGRNLAGNDDSGGVDSYVRFTVPADGNYFVRITDQLGRGGPDFTYRVEVAEVKSFLSFSIPQVGRGDSQSRQAMAVPRGGRYATLISVKRNDFRGDLVFQPANLPAGVALQADKLPGGQSAYPLVFEAAADAPVSGRIGDLNAHIAEGDKLKDIAGGHHQMVDWVISEPNQTVYYQSEVTGLAVAVVEEIPFSVDIVVPKVPLARNGTMDVTVVAKKKDGFDEPITLSMIWNPPGVGSVPSVVIPKGTNSITYRVNANGNAELRAWKIAMLASAEVKGARVWTSTQLASLEIADQFVSGKFDLTTTEQGKPAKVICKLEQKVPFDGKAKVSLSGLPAKVTAADREITKDDTQVVFDVVTETGSPAGSHRSLFCTIAVPRNGETINHTVASGGTLRIDAPRTKVTEPAPAKAKPKLSAKADITAAK